jgi:hypothetical protein
VKERGRGLTRGLTNKSVRKWVLKKVGKVIKVNRYFLLSFRRSLHWFRIKKPTDIIASYNPQRIIEVTMVNFQKTCGTRLIVSLVPKRARSRDSSVGIATGYGLDGGGKRRLSSLQGPDRLWGSEHRKLCPVGKAAGA